MHPDAAPRGPEDLPERLGRYRLVRRLGSGGMGEVFEAIDEALGRAVALKVVRDDRASPELRVRFLREARIAARVDHPNVCRLLEIGEEGERPFLVMELLAGEPLSARLQRGPLPLREAVDLLLPLLEALQAFHAEGLIHRDLKPSNVFLTPAGPKLLDFGLARTLDSAPGSEATVDNLTRTGTLLGTPHYMSPEQIQGRSLDGRSDLWAVAVLLFEMLTGRPPFEGRSMVEVFHAALHEAPPALGGSGAVAAVDAVIRRGLEKLPAERYPDAQAMALELRACLQQEGTASTPRIVALTRLVVLPFRVLRPDPETDFLAFSLPDALTGSLSQLGSLLVRSSMGMARYAQEPPDPARLAAEAQVDVALTGTLLRAGERIRVQTQLVEVPAGTVLWSRADQVGLGDLLQLEDELVGRIVASLSLPLTAREHRLLRMEVPASARAYEYYLRANQLGLQPSGWDLARDLYRQCLEEDPSYASGWARLGRIYRLKAKYGSVEDRGMLQEAETALRRALDLNPDLSLAHNLYAQLEVETARIPQALARLLERARAGSGKAEIHAALVMVLRLSGQFAPSLQADARAKALDPLVRTSVSFTHLLRGDDAAALATDADPAPIGTRGYALANLGRTAEALQLYREAEAQVGGRARDIARSMLDTLEGRPDPLRARIPSLLGIGDPEALYFGARMCSRLGEVETAAGLLERAVELGFACPQPLAGDPWLAPLRAAAAFAPILERARQQHARALAVYREGGGEALLGPADRP